MRALILGAAVLAGCTMSKQLHLGAPRAADPASAPASTAGAPAEASPAATVPEETAAAAPTPPAPPPPSAPAEAAAAPAPPAPAPAADDSAPASSFTIPDVEGLSVDVATRRLRAAGLTGDLEVVPDECPVRIDDRHACRTQPGAGQPFSPHLPLRLYVQDNPERGVAHGRAFVRMPNVVGMTLADAHALLVARGFTDVEIVQGGTCAPHLVCRQGAAAGRRAYLDMKLELDGYTPPE